MVPLKRRKRSCGTDSTGSGSGTEVKFPEVVVFLLERKMGRSRRDFLSGLARTKGLRVDDKFSDDVTHLVSENNSAEDVTAWLHLQGGAADQTSLWILDVSWLTDSVREGGPIQIQERHRLQVDLQGCASFVVPAYACQRLTPVDHQNRRLTDSLVLLAENAELNQDEGRAVAFRRAAAVLKVLPAEVTCAKYLRGLPGVGEHSLRVIKEVLESGKSSEVEKTRASEQFRALKLLTGIFGVGPKTADRWFRAGIHDLEQLQASGEVLNRAQRAGLLYYQDLNHPVSREEADAVEAIVQEAVLTVCPGAQVTMAGGFRRGKQSGHDVDFLVTHPEEGEEEGLLDRALVWLESKGFLLYHKTSKNSYLESAAGPAQSSTSMDHFERCFSILKLDLRPEPQSASAWLNPWRAVRVDLVVSPASQFAFALLGWTGSKLFERELRRWAARERSMSLSSHALYCHTQVQHAAMIRNQMQSGALELCSLLPQRKHLHAATEQEIFSHLSLDFVPPTERNA
ncbi:DNA-directed DNA/RNA polymerase mu isoform X1 [Synchiropus splendidus]|uniref:DNA-directed DNA/RNA polymerase mu isoform X1 n=1 Tax=Synchiropus splendidus TaxID=270530 RepID=UPI00237D5676|nr:DNA-directed DNA/RNA polymerase mu isoform X1 [Synchiropus splendidus]